MSRLQNLLTADYVPGMRKRRPVRWGIVTLVVTAIVVVLGVSHWVPWSSYSKTIKANYSYALHIYPHTPVRVNGYQVGSVTGSKLIGDSEVQLTMSITDSSVQVRPNASTQLYYRTLLGRNVFIALDPGTGSGSLSSPIPESRNGAQVEVDQALMPLQARARSGVQRTVQELGQGLDSTGATRETVQRAGSALTNMGGAVTAVRGENPGYDIPRLVTSGNDVFSALNTDEDALIGLINNANTSLAVTAARSADVDSILNQGPATLESTDETMLRLRRTEDILDPLTRELEPGVEKITPAVDIATPTLNEITKLVPTAVPTLQQLKPAVVSLGQLGQSGVPLIDGLNPTLDQVNSSVLPWLDQTSSVTHLKNYESIGPTFSTVSDSASDYDSGGFMQRFQPGLETGLTSLPFGASQCPSLFSSVPGGTAACQSLVSDINSLLQTATTSESAARK